MNSTQSLSRETPCLPDSEGEPADERSHPLSQLNRWLNQILIMGVTQCSGRDRFEGLIDELRHLGGYRAIIKRLQRVSEALPQDLLANEFQRATSGVTYGWSGWITQRASEVSDRSLYLPSQPSYGTGIKRPPPQSWVERLLDELGGLCMILQMTRHPEALSEPTEAQHQRRLGIGPHRLKDRAGTEISGHFLSLGVSSTSRFAQQRQITTWALHLESGEVVMSRASQARPNRGPTIAPPPIGRVFWGEGKSLLSPAPRQVLWRSVSQGPRPKAYSSSLLSEVKWSGSWGEVLGQWRDALALDPFAQRPLFALRGGRVAARWEGDHQGWDDQLLIQGSAPLSERDFTPPSVDTYLVDSEGVSARLYAPSRDRWSLIEASERGELMVIGEWGGRGFRPLVWCEERHDSPSPLRHIVHHMEVFHQKLCSLISGPKDHTAPPPRVLGELAEERAERAELSKLYRSRAESGLDPTLIEELELVNEVRRDLAALWLWRRADLPLTLPPPLYAYQDLLRASQAAIKEIQRVRSEQYVSPSSAIVDVSWPLPDERGDGEDEMPF